MLIARLVHSKNNDNCPLRSQYGEGLVIGVSKAFDKVLSELCGIGVHNDNYPHRFPYR